MNRVVVTGMGISTSLGRGLQTVWQRLLSGRNGIGPIRLFDASEYPCKVAAEVPDIPEGETGMESIPAGFCRRGVRLFLETAGEALDSSGLAKAGIARSQIGVSVGASVNYLQMAMLGHYFRCRSAGPSGRPVLDLKRFSDCCHQPESSFFLRQGELMAALPAKTYRLAGPNISVDAACAASAFAIEAAFRTIKRGEALAMVAGGGAALVNPLSMLAFALLGALSRSADPARASRPFDRQRDGFVMGEGAGAVVLENREHALHRGARVYGEVAGVGLTVSNHNLTDPSPQGCSEEKAMRLALEEADLVPHQVDYIAAHGTSTAKNDFIETMAIKRLFGDHARRLAVSSNKAQIGHTISAAGVCSLIFTLLAMGQGCLPPTMHYENPDPRCDLDYVPNACRAARVRAALVNSFAFGGQNAVLAVRNADAP